MTIRYAALLVGLYFGGFGAGCSSDSANDLRCPIPPATAAAATSCTANPSICATLGVNFSCNVTQGCCAEAVLGKCYKSADCATNDKPVCDLTSNVCVSCSSTNMQQGDQQCQQWATVQVDPLDRALCISGQCAECRTNSDCKRPGKSFCDPATNVCGGCTQHSQCPGSNLCKIDVSLLASGDTLANIGECVLPTALVYVDNSPATCDSAGAGGKPYCQVTQALASGKSYVMVKGNGGSMANLYQPVTLSTSGQRLIIVGPGRDVPYAAQQAVINGLSVQGGAQATLLNIALTNTAGQPAVVCTGSSSLYGRNLLISSTVAAPKGGIYANGCTKVDLEKIKIDGANGYGVYLTGGTAHRLVNSAIINSGSVAEPAALRLSGAASGLFAFNTLAGSRQGVLCDSGATISDTIVMANGPDPQVGTLCQQQRIVTAGVTLDPAYPTGGDPKLISDPSGLCVDKGQPDANRTIKDDYYGTSRPLGAGYDIGFHELR